jgi:hypothetical protein
MTFVWTYPWSLLDGDPGTALERIATRGVDGVALASHYHSIRTLEPRADPGPRFRSFPGGAYFDPGGALEDLTIDGHRNEIDGVADPLEAVRAAAGPAGLDVRAWTVCLHNTRLGRENPGHRVESAFGHAHDHALCPSDRAVREYYAALVRALVSSGVDGVDLESIGFPSAFHGHGVAFGHEKNFAFASPAAEWLVSQCFCGACRELAGDRLDVAAALERVRSLCRRAAGSGGRSLPALSALVREHPVLAELFAFRADVVEAFVERLQDASGSVPLNYYVADGFGRGPGDGWPAGVVLERVGEHLDRATALAYTDDPGTARERVRKLRERVGVPVDAGVTLDPAVVDSRSAFETVATAAREAADGELYVYNHALATEDHLKWVASVA